jgi:HD-like signal output (HDOD) protein/tRNA A-37 threonylcarbamoyl transferase component Bud32
MSEKMSGQGSGAPSGDGGSAGGPAGAAGASLIGATLGNYRVSRLLGSGGMGSVFLAEHVLIGRQVAIKVLDPQIADHPEVISRFFVEARAVNEIRHPNIVEVTDLGTHQGRPFIVMEYLPGETLEGRLAKQGKFSAEDTVRIGRQVASALGAAHERGMVHRDLKPANIMLRDHEDYPDFVKVLDFGIAKLLVTSTPVDHRTEVGTVLGTPAYMSPEQCLGDAELDHRSDVYSLGVILFLMLSGRLPFEGETFGRLIISHVHEPAPKLASIASAVPPGLAAVVDRCLAKKPEDRFATMKELRLALERAAGEAVFPRSLTPVSGVPVVSAAPAAEHKPAPVVVPARPAVPAPPAAAVTRVPAPTPAPVTLSYGAPAAGSLRDGKRLEEAVSERLLRGQIALPPLPAIYAQCLDLLRDPGVSFAAVAALVKQDARLASHVVRRANSDANAGRGVATTPEQAIARLGALGARTAIIELGARRVIDTRNERLEDEVRRPWQHALACAVVAERLARLQGLEARIADVQLAALLKDIGVPLVAAMTFEIEWELSGKRGQQTTPEIWWPIVRVHHRKAAELLVSHWNLPDELSRGVREAGRFDPAAGWSLGNVACLAGALADRDGFYLRRESLGDDEGVIDGGTRVLGLGELKIRRATERLKEAVRLRE